MDDLQETLRTLSIGRSSPLRMRSVSPSPPPPSGDPCSLSPGPERRRAATYSAGQLIRPRVRGIRRRLDHHGAERGSSGGQGSWFSPPRPLPQVKSQPRTSPAHRRHLPRDPIQPSTGSISDLSDRHSSAGEGDDENESDRDDHFSLTAHPHFRPRAKTCPENRAWRRRKLKAMNRPPTPPPTSSPTLGLISSSLDVPGSPCRSPLGGSMERLRSSRDLPSFEEEDDVWHHVMWTVKKVHIVNTV